MDSIQRCIIPVSTVALSMVLAAGCSSSGSDLAAEGEQEEQQTITLVEQPWEDLMVENQMVSQILGEAGYTVEVEELTVPIGAQSLAQNDVDAYLGNWWPSQEDAFTEFIEAGDVEVLSTLVEGVAYEPAVPSYVADEYDIASLADLDPNADDFDSEILGIEGGSPGNVSILDMIEEDAYDLGGWELVESGTPAMLAEVERRASEDEPVVFLAWEPHWMNVEWDLVYLEDPEEAWPGAGEIRVATRAGFEDESPNVARFLSQMEIDGDTASDWVFRVSQEGEAPEDVASAWIAENPDEVSSWLDGVETTDGDPAEPPA